jgi:hypothetical protein
MPVIGVLYSFDGIVTLPIEREKLRSVEEKAEHVEVTEVVHCL